MKKKKKKQQDWTDAPSARLMLTLRAYYPYVRVPPVVRRRGWGKGDDDHGDDENEDAIVEWREVGGVGSADRRIRGGFGLHS